MWALGTTLLILLATTVLHVHAAYRLVDMGAPAPSVATAVNDLGQVVGEADAGPVTDINGKVVIPSISHAFVWSAGHFQTMGTLPVQASEGYGISVAYAINQKGLAVGAGGSFLPESMSGLVFASPFLYQHGALTELGAPIDSQNEHPFGMFQNQQAFGINENGTIVGSGSYRGFVNALGKQVVIPPLSDLEEGNGTVGVAVNDSEAVVGATTVGVPTDRPRIHAFVWKWLASPRLVDLGTLRGYQDSIAMAVNASGTIVGYTSQGWIERSTIGGKWVGARTHDTLEFTALPMTGHAVEWRFGATVDLGALPASRYSAAFGINDAGVVVGTSSGRATVWMDDRPLDLNAMVDMPAGWQLVEARGINNRGWIVGWGTFRGSHRAFLLIPRQG